MKWGFSSAPAAGRVSASVAAGAPLLGLVALFAAPSVRLAWPTGLAVAAALVTSVAVLHLVVRRRGSRRVASLFLWRGIVDAPAPRRGFRLTPFWREPLFWCRASAVGLISSACVGPVWTPPDDDTAVIYVRDGSATLATRTADGSLRDGVAREWLRKQVRSGSGPAGLVTAQGVWRVGTDRETLLAAIDGLPAPSGWRDAPELLVAAAAERRRFGGPAKVTFVTDNTDGAAEEALSAGALAAACAEGWCRVHVVDDDRSPRDVRIAGAPTVAATRRPVQIELHSAADAPIDASIRLERLDAAGYPSAPILRSLHVAPGSIRVPVELPEPGCWRISLDGADDLAAGDSVHLCAGQVQHRVCVVGEEGAGIADLAVAATRAAAENTAAADCRAEPIPPNEGDLLRNRCSSYVLAGAQGFADLIDSAIMRGSPSVVLLLDPGGPPRPVTRVDPRWREIADLELRLLPLSPLSRFGLAQDDARPVAWVGDEPAIAIRTSSGMPQFLVGLRQLGIEGPDEETTVSGLVAVLARQLWHRPHVREVPARGRLGRSVCPSGESTTAVDGAVFDDAPAPHPGGCAASSYRVTGLDPAIRNVRAQPARLPSLSPAGPSERVLWPWLLTAAIAVLGIEAAASRRGGGG